VFPARWELGFEILASQHHFVLHPSKINIRITPWFNPVTIKVL
jgi:hypothetical protein